MSFPVTYAGDFGGLARPRGGQQLADLPRKDAGVLSFAADYRGDDPRGEEPGPAPSDALGAQQPRAAVAAQDLAHAPVRHLKRAVAPRSPNTFRPQKPNVKVNVKAYSQHPGDLARTDSLRRQFDHFPPLGHRKRSAVQKGASQLVDTSTNLTQERVVLERVNVLNMQEELANTTRIRARRCA